MKWKTSIAAYMAVKLSLVRNMGMKSSPTQEAVSVSPLLSMEAAIYPVRRTYGKQQVLPRHVLPDTYTLIKLIILR